MAFSQAKTGWDSLRKRKKNYCSDQLLPDQELKIPKRTSKKILKIKKHHHVFISSQTGSGVAEKE